MNANEGVCRGRGRVYTRTRRSRPENISDAKTNNLPYMLGNAEYCATIYMNGNSYNGIGIILPGVVENTGL